MDLTIGRAFLLHSLTEDVRDQLTELKKLIKYVPHRMVEAVDTWKRESVKLNDNLLRILEVVREFEIDEVDTDCQWMFDGECEETLGLEFFGRLLRACVYIKELTETAQEMSETLTGTDEDMQVHGRFGYRQHVGEFLEHELYVCCYDVNSIGAALFKPLSPSNQTP